jgi:hypothetical protein
VLESGKAALAPFGDRPGAWLLRAAADHIFAALRASYAPTEERSL